MSTSFKRRDFLRTFAASSLLLPFVRPLEAFSQTEVAPKRLLLWFQPVGVEEGTWFPSGNSKAFNEAADLGPTLNVLEPWKDKVNVIDNVSMYSSYHEPIRVAPHDAGCCELWTNQACQPAIDGVSFTHSGEYDTWSWPLGPSIDQFLADQSVVRGTAPLRSLELGVQVVETRTNRRMSYTAAGTPVAPENDPRVVLQRLFGMGQSEDELAAARDERTRKRILDRVSGDLARLSSRLGGTDRETLERYTFALESLEKEVTGSLNSGECIAPVDDGSVTNWNDNNQIPAIGRMQMKAMAAAFACDLTRVGSMMWLGSEPRNRMTWLGDGGKDQEYHLCSHKQLPGITADEQTRWLVETDKWFASQLAFFLQELQTLDPSGALINNTLIVCGNELRHGNSHSRDRIPFLTIGGDWYFKTGYYRKAQEERRHGDLLAEVSRCMGVDVDNFGNPEYCDGPALGLTTSPV